MMHGCFSRPLTPYAVCAVLLELIAMHPPEFEFVKGSGLEPRGCSDTGFVASLPTGTRRLTANVSAVHLRSRLVEREITQRTRASVLLKLGGSRGNRTPVIGL